MIHRTTKARYGILRMLLMLLLLSGAISVAAQTYISDVCISSHKQRTQAIMQAQMKGWEVIDGDLNWDAGGDYIFLCVKRTNSVDEAITDMVIMNGSDYKYNSGRTVRVDGLTYRPAELFDDNPSSLAGDLNKDAGGSDLFLYVTREKKSNETPYFITNLKVRSFGDDAHDEKFVREGHHNGGKGDCIDCNKRAGGRYVYIEMSKGLAPQLSDVKELQQAFNVYRAGGGLYQIDVPLLFRWGDGDNYLVGGGTFSGDPSNVVLYLPAGADASKDSNWHVAFQVKTDGRSDGRLYDAPRPCQWIPREGTLQSLHKLATVDQPTNEEQNYGNEENLKYASTYWRAPEGVDVARFRLIVQGCTVGQTSRRTLYSTIEKEDVTMEAPTGMNLVRVIDPIVNLISTGEASNVASPGSQILQMQTANAMHRVSLWDATLGRIIPGTSIYPDDETTAFTYSLDHYDEEHSLAVLAYGNERVIDSRGASSLQDRGYVLPVSLHPFHSITSCSVEQRDSVDTNGVFGAKNIVRWTVPNVRAADAMPEDEYIVQRAYRPDFSDAITIGSLSVGTLPGNDLTIDHATNIGTFTFIDYDEGGWYNPLDTLPDAKIYYRVFRAIVYARWGEASMADFCCTDSLASDNYLAQPSRITVQRMEHFDVEKTVKVRVELPQNTTPPYFWHEDADIIIERFSPAHEHYEGRDYAQKTITIPGSDVRYDSALGIYYAEVEDIQGAPYLHYYYTARVDARKSPFPVLHADAVTTTQTEAKLCYSETLAPIRTFTASRGTVKGLVALEWETDEGLVDYFHLERRPYGSTREEDYAPLHLPTPLSASYQDATAASAQVYEYRVTASINLYGKTYQHTATTYGWNPYYGTLHGTLRMKNGALLPGSVTLRVTSVSPTTDTPTSVTIPEVRSLDSDTIIVPSYNKIYERAVTTDNGSFEFDDIPYIGTTRYQIEVSANGSDFVRKGQEDAEAGKLFFVALDNSLIDPQVELICKSTRTFSGRVLYTDTTIPVRDCQFRMNGSTLLNADGSTLTTDSKGNFAFELPSIKMDLQVVKDGHTFLNNGCIMGRTDDLSTEDDPALGKFTPSADYPGLLLYDDTKVRLVGRLTGGELQGSKPLGLGLSTNNLGDHLKMVLELEGDPTAQIVYDNEHPDQTTREAQFTQRNYDLNEQISGQTGKEACPTTVTFEKKRIVINPDTKTGEFCLDLVPTKYKVTELSADGYPTLFGPGEGFQVLDLSQKIELKTDTIVMTDKLNDKFSRVTQYHASYKNIHHNPVTVTLTQYEMGQPCDYFGAKEISETDLSGKKNKVPMFSLTEKKDSVVYLFEKPVFVEGKNYDIQIRAHEDYYYNGNTQLQPDVVYLEGGQLTVRNGLVGNESETKLKLDKEGKAMISFVAANPTFSDTGEDALRSIRVQVKNNGYYYESKELQAYVTGSRKKGNDVITVDEDITLLDVIRDPYGSRSSAYREAGTKYHWEHTSSLKVANNMKLKVKTGTQQAYFTGVWAGMGTGTLAGLTNDSESSSEMSITYPMAGFSLKRTEEYDMTLNTRIETSSDPLDVGAMADVYLGVVNTIDISRVETFGIINQTTYDMVQPGIEAGAIRVVREGKDADSMPFYLVVSDKIGVTRGKPRDFVYTQKYIVNTLMPSLDQMAAAQMLDCSKEEAQLIADKSGETKYIWGVDDNGERTIVDIRPQKEEQTTNVLTPETLWNTMLRWATIVSQNEQTKLEAMQAGNPLDKAYSITASSKVDHTEGAEWYEKNIERWNILNIDTDKGWKGWKGISASAELYLEAKGNPGKKEHTESVDGEDNDFLVWHTSLNVMGSTLSITWQPFSPTFDYANDYSTLITYSGGSGYAIETNDNSYLDINVHQVQPYKFENYFDREQMEWVSAKNVAEAAKIHEWVYSVKGGAERQPWYEPDSTLFYRPGTPLTTRTLRIDNPRIYIDNPVVSNVPSGEKAVFKVRLANETELPTRPEGLNPSKFILFLDDEYCPDGAAITMDGQPIADGREFYLDPGQSITKTIVVERQGKTYNYENMRLGFMDDAMSLLDYATLSVHFMPSSTPVNMVMPADKWVLNTLSAVDEQGRYYLPVEVNGYDVNYENFDHIEVQYKKHTDGDSKWVNLCSYYKDKDLYEKASGEKAMLGKISLRFYGDADPVEMQYDLRAVSFCRLGNGYVTKSSEVVTGTKDTRAPEVFGVPKPTNGVLTFEDVISVPFSEPIAYNYLDETANFQVVGYTNDSETTYETALAFSSEASHYPSEGVENEVPTSKIKRNLSERDFTISAVVRLTSEADQATFMKINDHDVTTDSNVSDYTLDFCYRDGRLVAYINSVVFVSKSIYEEPLVAKGLSLHGKMTSVAMTYHRPENTPEGDPQVHFYLDGVELPMDYISLLSGDAIGEPQDGSGMTDFNDAVECNVYGHIEVGEPTMDARMANVRLWDKVLPVSELMGKMNKRLNGTEPGLLGYWPMDEMAGNVLYDKAHGADLHFTRQTWVLPEGQHSLRLNGEPLRLLNTEPFAREDFEDYTLGFWMQPQNIDSQAMADGTVNVFQAGADDSANRFRLYFDNGAFKLQSGKNTFIVCSQKDVADGNWHNVSVVANKSMNACTAYVDGQPTLMVSGSELSGLQETAFLGGHGFYGNLDNLSFWHLAFPANNLAMIYNYAPSGHEMGLAYYLPFEMDKTNEQNTWSSVFCPYNMVYKRKADGTECEKELAINGNNDVLRELDNSKSYPAVRSLAGITNIPFSWSSNGNELQISLKQRDADINHQQIFVTVRGVEDLAGNTMKNPLMMSMYVDRSVLTWQENKLDITVPYGTEALFRAAWTNKSGRSVAYTIESNNPWLTPSTTMGTAGPMALEQMHVNVSDNLPPGKYTGIIYLVDENGLSSPLTVNLTVEAFEPEWTVTDQKGYSLQMGLVARVKVKTAAGSEYYDMDARDRVACFDKAGRCVGLAGITVDNKRNAASVNMTIYGTTAMNAERQELSFRLWRASTNETYFLRTANDEPILFEQDKLIGCPPAEPITLVTDNQKMQNIELERGWNWVSFNVKPGEHSLAGLFSTNDVFEQGDYVVFSTNKGVRTAEYSEFLGKGCWSNCLPFNADRITMNIYVSHPCVVSVAGSEYTDADRYVQLTNRAGREGTWNDLPYLLTVDQPINMALSDLASITLMDGTIVKSRKEFAVIDRATNTWVGSLQTMHPGVGYYIRYYNDDIRMKYTNTNVAAKVPRTSPAPSKGGENVAASSSSAGLPLQSERAGGEALGEGYMTTMPVIAQVENATEWLEGDAIVAYAGGELTGVATLTELPDGRRLAFLTVSAEQGDDIRFAHVRDGEVIALSSKHSALSYDGNGVAGTLAQPYLISFNGEDGANGIYDLGGVRYPNMKSLKNRPGVLIINGKKELKK